MWTFIEAINQEKKTILSILNTVEELIDHFDKTGDLVQLNNLLNSANLSACPKPDVVPEGQPVHQPTPLVPAPTTKQTAPSASNPPSRYAAPILTHMTPVALALVLMASICPMCYTDAVLVNE